MDIWRSKRRKKLCTELSTRLILPCIVVLLALVAGCGTSDDGRLGLSASIDGQPIAESSRTSPLTLDPAQPAVVQIVAANRTDQPLNVRSVRLEGSVLGMRFAHANTQVNFDVPASGQREYEVLVDFFDLADQVGGHTEGRLSLYDESRELLATEPLFLDVKSGFGSNLGTTFFMVLAFAALTVVSNLLGVARHRLPPNRFQRGLRFAAMALAIVVAAFLFLALIGLWIVPAALWVPVLIIGTIAGFALGYISPGPLADEDDEEDLVVATRR